MRFDVYDLVIARSVAEPAASGAWRKQSRNAWLGMGCGLLRFARNDTLMKARNDKYQRVTSKKGGISMASSFGYNAWFQKKDRKISAKIEGADVFAATELREILGELYEHGGEELTIRLVINASLPKEGFSIKYSEQGINIEGGSETGLLYGAYRLTFNLGQNDSTDIINEKPVVDKRILNHWDNGDGSVERGYSGKSLFWKNGRIGYDLARLKDYARLLASVGINLISINNVNVKPDTAKLLTNEGLADLKKVADVFRPFGIRLIIAVHFDSPVWISGCASSDPVLPEVKEFWQNAAEQVYSTIPDIAGFLIKADSEFQTGPNSFGHTQDVGANVIAKALQPHGGNLFWRCFVYNCQQDWRDKVTDRPKAAYDNFYPLDGKFEKNVILQIKHGPSDFQVREPNSPLFGAMTSTRQALEFQIAQEYTGHQIDLYAWAVQWQEIYEQPVCKKSILRDLIGNKIESVVAVSNTGDDDNWCGNILAQANLYAFGRMAWNALLTAEDVSKEWTKLTFGNIPEITDMLLASRHTYEKYTSPLGIGWMVNVHTHYGPSVDGYEYSKWGTYHRADTKAIGVDRTTGGTGYTAQYNQYVRDLYENIDTCPEEMLLFFHRLPYDHVLKSGKTLIQHIYDTHFEGVEEVEGFIKTLEAIKDKLPQEAYENAHERMRRQMINAKEWRDVVNTYFYRKTGIIDVKGRRIYD